MFSRLFLFWVEHTSANLCHEAWMLAKEMNVASTQEPVQDFYSERLEELMVELEELAAFHAEDDLLTR